MSTRAEQHKRLKRWLAGMSAAGHLESLKAKRKKRIQSIRWGRRIRREGKKALSKWWAELYDEIIMEHLRGE
jgi:hypothetical protein